MDIAAMNSLIHELRRTEEITIAILLAMFEMFKFMQDRHRFVKLEAVSQYCPGAMFSRSIVY